MRRTQCFDYRVTWRRPAFRLKFFLQHRFVVRFRGTQRVGRFEFRPEGAANELSRRFESAIEKDRARDRFENISQQSILLPSTTLFFAAPETEKLAELQSLRRFGERWRTDEPV